MSSRRQGGQSEAKGAGGERGGGVAAAAATAGPQSQKARPPPPSRPLPTPPAPISPRSELRSHAIAPDADNESLRSSSGPDMSRTTDRLGHAPGSRRQRNLQLGVSTRSSVNGKDPLGSPVAVPRMVRHVRDILQELNELHQGTVQNGADPKTFARAEELLFRARALFADMAEAGTLSSAQQQILPALKETVEQAAADLLKLHKSQFLRTGKHKSSPNTKGGLIVPPRDSASSNSRSSSSSKGEADVVATTKRAQALIKTLRRILNQSGGEDDDDENQEPLRQTEDAESNTGSEIEAGLSAQLTEMQEELVALQSLPPSSSMSLDASKLDKLTQYFASAVEALNQLQHARQQAASTESATTSDAGVPFRAAPASSFAPMPFNEYQRKLKAQEVSRKTGNKRPDGLISQLTQGADVTGPSTSKSSSSPARTGFGSAPRFETKEERRRRVRGKLPLHVALREKRAESEGQVLDIDVNFDATRPRTTGAPLIGRPSESSESQETPADRARRRRRIAQKARELAARGPGSYEPKYSQIDASVGGVVPLPPRTGESGEGGENIRQSGRFNLARTGEDRAEQLGPGGYAVKDSVVRQRTKGGSWKGSTSRKDPRGKALQKYISKLQSQKRRDEEKSQVEQPDADSRSSPGASRRSNRGGEGGESTAALTLTQQQIRRKILDRERNQRISEKLAAKEAERDARLQQMQEEADSHQHALQEKRKEEAITGGTRRRRVFGSKANEETETPLDPSDVFLSNHVRKPVFQYHEPSNQLSAKQKVARRRQEKKRLALEQAIADRERQMQEAAEAGQEGGESRITAWSGATSRGIGGIYGNPEWDDGEWEEDDEDLGDGQGRPRRRRKPIDRRRGYNAARGIEYLEPKVRGVGFGSAPGRWGDDGDYLSDEEDLFPEGNALRVNADKSRLYVRGDKRTAAHAFNPPRHRPLDVDGAASDGELDYQDGDGPQSRRRRRRRGCGAAPPDPERFINLRDSITRERVRGFSMANLTSRSLDAAKDALETAANHLGPHRYAPDHSNVEPNVWGPKFSGAPLDKQRIEEEQLAASRKTRGLDKSPMTVLNPDDRVVRHRRRGAVPFAAYSDRHDSADARKYANAADNDDLVQFDGDVLVLEKTYKIVDPHLGDTISMDKTIGRHGARGAAPTQEIDNWEMEEVIEGDKLLLNPDKPGTSAPLGTFSKAVRPVGKAQKKVRRLNEHGEWEEVLVDADGKDGQGRMILNSYQTVDAQGRPLHHNRGVVSMSKHGDNVRGADDAAFVDEWGFPLDGELNPEGDTLTIDPDKAGRRVRGTIPFGKGLGREAPIDGVREVDGSVQYLDGQPRLPLNPDHSAVSPMTKLGHAMDQAPRFGDSTTGATNKSNERLVLAADLDVAIRKDPTSAFFSTANDPQNPLANASKLQHDAHEGDHLALQPDVSRQHLNPHMAGAGDFDRETGRNAVPIGSAPPVDPNDARAALNVDKARAQTTFEKSPVKIGFPQAVRPIGEAGEAAEEARRKAAQDGSDPRLVLSTAQAWDAANGQHIQALDLANAAPRWNDDAVKAKAEEGEGSLLVLNPNLSAVRRSAPSFSVPLEGIDDDLKELERDRPLELVLMPRYEKSSERPAASAAAIGDAERFQDLDDDWRRLPPANNKDPVLKQPSSAIVDFDAERFPDPSDRDAPSDRELLEYFLGAGSAPGTGWGAAVIDDEAASHIVDSLHSQLQARRGIAENDEYLSTRQPRDHAPVIGPDQGPPLGPPPAMSTDDVFGELSRALDEQRLARMARNPRMIRHAALDGSFARVPQARKATGDGNLMDHLSDDFRRQVLQREREALRADRVLRESQEAVEKEMARIEHEAAAMAFAANIAERERATKRAKQHAQQAFLMQQERHRQAAAAAAAHAAMFQGDEPAAVGDDIQLSKRAARHAAVERDRRARLDPDDQEQERRRLWRANRNLLHLPPSKSKRSHPLQSPAQPPKSILKKPGAKKPKKRIRWGDQDVFEDNQARKWMDARSPSRAQSRRRGPLTPSGMPVSDMALVGQRMPESEPLDMPSLADLGLDVDLDESIDWDFLEQTHHQ